MRKLFSVRKRLIGLGLMGALVVAVAVLGGLWGLSLTASANGSVNLVHVSPDGTDYAGNDYCPEGGMPIDDDGDTISDRWIDDCNNITSQRHVIRTDGLDPDTMTAGNWILGADGVGDILEEGACGALTEVTNRSGWGDEDGDGLKDEDGDDCANAVDDDPADDYDYDDNSYINDGCPQVGVTSEASIAGACAADDANDDDGDTVVNDGCPVINNISEAAIDNDGDTTVNEDGPGDPRDDEQCVVIHSSWPGETWVSLSYNTTSSGAESGAECANNVDDDGDTVVNDGCPGQPIETACTDAESGAACGADTADNDNDGAVNDGCPAVGAQETGAQCDNATDDDNDGAVNDGCPVVGIDDDNDGFMNDGCPPFGTPETGAQCASGNETDDDDDGLINDGCPGQVVESGDQCLDAIDSLVTEVIDGTPVADGFVNDGCPEVDPVVTGTTTTEVVKEWDSLDDSVILLSGPTDEDGDTDIDADDHHLADVQGTWLTNPVIWDEGIKRVRSYPPIEITEIVHGEHDVLINSETITLHHPTEGAIFYAEIDSDKGCTFFTDPTGAEDFGTAMNGVSDGGGRFMGPHTAPAQTQAVTSLNPDSHNGTSAQGDWDIQDIHIDTICEEQATVTIWAGYPGSPGSLRVPAVEWIGLNWETVEEAKQPQIRWAGEQIVLAKRWALADTYYPNETTEVVAGDVIDIFEDVCPYAGNVVQYNREDGPGGLETGIPNVTALNAPDSVSTFITWDCTSRAMYESEDPGQVNVKAVLWEYGVDWWMGYQWEHESELNSCIDRYNNIARNGADGGSRTELGDEDGDTDIDADDVTFCLNWEDWTYQQAFADLEPSDLVLEDNKHAFLVWYLKIYQVKLTNTAAEFEDHNAGDPDVPIITDEYAPPDTDSEEDTLNVSESTVLRVLVKGWFYGGNNSSRGDICVDRDGDGDGAGSEPGAPYPTVSHEGCADPDDEMLTAGYWVLPDDLESLAGADPNFTRRSWDVMSDIGDDVVNSGAIGPKSTLDSHDNVVRPWVPCLDPDYCATDGGRKTIDPDGEVTIADAIMPPLKIRAYIEDANDAGFFHHGGEPYAEIDKDAGDNLYDSIMIPADPEIPWQVNNGGYDWNSWMSEFGPYVFWHIFNKPVSELDGCDSTSPGPLCNATVGNQNDHRSDDPEHPRLVELYTDNRGEAQIGLNGDYNLGFDDCVIQTLWGAPDCEPGDVVGQTTIRVSGDYPYFRKHAAIWSNPVIKTWTWGGFKEVTAERIDATHTAIIAHLKDRDGYCKYDVDVDDTIDVVFSPSANPVQHEEITFILNTEVGSIVSMSNYAEFSAPHTPLGDAIVTGAGDGVLIDRSEAVALAEDARVLEGMEELGMIPVGARDPMEEDECQAWVLIEHPVDADPDVSVYLDDPEGLVARHWPPSTLLINLVAGWNDACYVGPEASVEDAAATLLGDDNETGVTDLLAIYRLDNETQEFDRWFPDAAEGVNTIEALGESDQYDQLFILMEVGIDWLQEITPAPDSADLVEGWSSICYAGESKGVEDATSNIIGDFEILYSLGSDQLWRRFVPGRADLTNIVTLNQYTSVFLLVTTEGGATWVFNP